MFSNVQSKIKNLPSNLKFAFASSVTIGLATHLYKFTNYLPNNDSLYALFSKQNVIESGRWFLEFPAWISSNFDLPLIIGILSILYIAITVMIIVSIFEINNKAVIALISGIITTYPSITAIFFYGYTSDAYMFALMMATFAVYFSRFSETRLSRLLLSALLICLTCATYQAFIPYALVLIIIYFAYNVLDGKYSIKQLLAFIIKQVVIIGIGMIAYLVVWKSVLKLRHFEATSYLGIKSAGIDFQTILVGLKRSVEEILYFLFESNLSRERLTVYSALNIVLIISLIIGLFVAIIKSKLYLSSLKLTLLIASLMFSAPCVIIWDLVSEETVASARTLMAMSLYLVFVVLIYERWFSIKIKNTIGVFIALAIFNYSIMANVGYFTLNRSWQVSVNKAVELMLTIHNYENEYDISKIAFVGEGSYDYPIVNDASLTDASNRSNFYNKYRIMAFNGDLLFDNTHAYLYLVNYCGLDLDYVNNDELIVLQSANEVSQLSCWPSDKSITVLEDTLIIKISNNMDYWWTE